MKLYEYGLAPPVAITSIEPEVLPQISFTSLAVSVMLLETEIVVSKLITQPLLSVITQE